MSEKITFKELVELIAEQSKQSQSSANSFIHELVQIIEGGLKKSGSVSISGFGKFELRWMNERSGVHPQTGEEITIPGQNKVVFKPYKALREEVNKPFANLKSRLIREQIPDDAATLPVSLTEEDPQEREKEQDQTREKEKSAIPFAAAAGSKTPIKQYPPIDELIIERDNPHYHTGAAIAAPAEQEMEKETTVPAMLPNEAQVAKEVQKSGSFKWSYAAAVVIALAAFIILFYMMQRSSGVDETASTTGQTEQQFLSPVVPAIGAEEDETEDDDVPTDTEGPPDDEAAPSEDIDTNPTGEPDIAEDDTRTSQSEFVTESIIVEPGQSLWTIAQNELGNPYLWPLLYHLNGDIMENPNQLPAAADLDIPQISNPENLNSFEREQVALGYFSLYEWNTENNPDEARYFLWAVGVFSPDMLDAPPSEVNPEDLAFARNR